MKKSKFSETRKPTPGSWGALCVALQQELPEAEYVHLGIGVGEGTPIWGEGPGAFGNSFRRAKDVVALWHEGGNEGYIFRVIEMYGDRTYNTRLSGKVWTEDEAIAAATMAQKHINRLMRDFNSL